jgi:hypothetical protein
MMNMVVEDDEEKYVYVMMDVSAGEYEFIGRVFSTEEKAREFKKQRMKEETYLKDEDILIERVKLDSYNKEYL